VATDAYARAPSVASEPDSPNHLLAPAVLPEPVGQSPTSLNAGNMTMARLALTLSGLVGRVVNDETGLAGNYDLLLTFAPEPRPGLGGPPIPVDPDAPSIFTALSDQLGLRLTSTRGPVEVVVIDKIERPTAD
jgi:uncharacterized protein (TIGR03435 family)